MLRSIQQRDLDRNRWIKITMGVILVLICVSMVVTLIPGLDERNGRQQPGRNCHRCRSKHYRRLIFSSNSTEPHAANPFQRCSGPRMPSRSSIR